MKYHEKRHDKLMTLLCVKSIQQIHDCVVCHKNTWQSTFCFFWGGDLGLVWLMKNIEL
jgi:hypothetical protein